MSRRHVIAQDAAPLIAAMRAETITNQTCLRSEAMEQRLKKRWFRHPWDESLHDAGIALRELWFQRCGTVRHHRLRRAY